MKKTWKSIIFAAALSLSLSISAAAGSWQSDAAGTWYQNDDGSYPTSCWQWIDENYDGIAESYCFNDKGYLYISTTTPDGYTVNENGAWTVNGVVQTQVIPQTQDPLQPQEQTLPTAPEQKTQTSSSGSTSISSVPFDGYTIIVNTNTKKYHVPSCRSVKTIKQSNLGYSDNSAALDALGYVPCKNCH